MDNSFDEQMERYKKQMLHFYKIGRQRGPEPEAIPAAVYPSNDPPPPENPPELVEQQAQPERAPVPMAQEAQPQAGSDLEQMMEREDLRHPEEIQEEEPRIEPQRPQIDGITFEVPGNEALDQYLEENPRIGFLKMQVSTARSAILIKGAKVTVSRRIGDEQHVFASTTTDMDGLVAPIPLPAPDRSLSEQPESQGEPVPFATYDIKTEYPMHVTVENFNVPIFDGIVSIQPVSLTPDTNPKPAPEEIYEEEPEEL